MSRLASGRLSLWLLTPLFLVGGVVCSADAVASRWLTSRLGVDPPDDLVRRNEARGYHRGFNDGFDHGVAVGVALGRRLEALRWAAELDRWRRLVRWTARQSTLGER
jgi:hypothetical protein